MKGKHPWVAGLAMVAIALALPAHANVGGLAPWQELVRFRPDAKRLHAERAAGRLAPVDFQIQRIEAARGEHVNFDEFAVTITQLPTSGPRTAEDLTAYIRSHLDEFLDDAYARFDALEESDAVAWRDAGTTGALLRFRIPALSSRLGATAYAAEEEAVVVASAIGSHSFTFSTVSIGPFAPGEHPVSGNRQFGVRGGNGEPLQVYTRGADRVIDGADSPSTLRRANAAIASEATIFGGADALWQSFQRNVKHFVEARGGQARIEAPIMKRPSWLSQEAAAAFGTDLSTLRVAAQLQREQDARDDARQRATLAEMISWPRVLKRRAWDYLASAAGLACARPNQFRRRYAAEAFPGVQFSEQDFRDLYDRELARQDARSDVSKAPSEPLNACQRQVLSAIQASPSPFSWASVEREAEGYRAAHPGLLARLAQSAARSARSMDRFVDDLAGTVPSAPPGAASEPSPPQRGTSSIHNIDLSPPRWEPHSTLGD